MKKINMISHLNAIARLFVASFLLQTLKACSLYTGMSTVIIETFDELQCALSEGIPHIIVNQSFSFRSTLEIYGGSRTLIGKSLGGYAVKLTGPINSRLFNITSANLTISSLKLVGSFSSESHSIEYGGLLLAEHSVLKLVNATLAVAWLNVQEQYTPTPQIYISTIHYLLTILHYHRIQFLNLVAVQSLQLMLSTCPLQGVVLYRITDILVERSAPLSYIQF